MSHLPLQFTNSTTEMSAAIEGTFDPLLVALSFVIASVAGYAALVIAERLRATADQRVRHVWLAAGAFAMGSGIWAMHFIGMLAFTLPVAVNYDRTLTTLSLLPAVLASSAALQFMKAPKLGIGRLNLAGLLMASGIGTMHFTGMAAMIMNAEMRYDLVLFVASIGVAHVLATLALYCRQVLSRRTSRFATQLASAVILGCAVGCMHYTAMASAFYFPSVGTLPPASALSPTALAFAVTLVAGLILGTAIVTAVVDRRLQEAHSRVKLILDSAGEGIYGLDLAGRVTFVNPAARAMLGWEVEQFIGEFAHAAVQHSHADKSVYLEEESPIHKALKNQAVHRVRDEVFWRRDGTSFPVEYVSTPMRTTHGEIVGVVVTFRDLTEQRALEAQLVQAQKLESIGQLAAGIAHEINTPAQYVGDNMEFLAQCFGELEELLKRYRVLHAAAKAGDIPPALISEVSEAVEEVDIDFLEQEIPRALLQSREGIKRVTEIVLAMKEFSHPGSDQMKPIDLNRAIAGTVTVARNEWKYVAELEMEFDANLPRVPCLAGEFNSVVLNLIVNAAHALAEKGSDEKGQIRIRTQREGEGWVVIEISDTGAGIPKEIQSKVFDPFFTTKAVGEGTGQGLAIAHSVVVDKHGGTIEVESEVGHGTTFRIRLPLAVASDGQEEGTK